LFRQAGFNDVELSVQPEIHWHRSPGYVAWLQNIIGNLESARRGLLEAGLITERDLDEGVNDLERLKARDDGSSVFVWNRAMARR
jgi:hypothetical protein